MKIQTVYIGNSKQDFACMNLKKLAKCKKEWELQMA